MRTTIDVWKLAREQRDAISSCEDRASKMVRAASEAHRKEHPLPINVLERIHAAFASGQPLCCTAGREVLEELGLDECWVAYINNWAYEKLGCDEMDKPGGCAYERDLERLQTFLDGLTL